MPHPVFALRGALLLACAAGCAGAFAQAALQTDAAASAAERAQRETDRTMYWIRVLATKPPPAKAAPVPPPKAVAAAAPAAAKPAAEPRDKPKAAAAPTVVAAAQVAPAPQVGRDPNPVQSPVSDTPEPSALSSRAADNAAARTSTLQLDASPSPPPEPDPGLIQVKSVRPDFPGNVVQRVRKGHVEVRFEVDPNGTVVDADVTGSSNAHLNAAALDAVRQWRFKPTPASHTAAVDLVFDIDKEK